MAKRCMTAPDPPPPAAPSLVARATSDGVGAGKKMTLWEREAFEASEATIAAEREAKIAALEQQRLKEAAESESRMAAFKKQEEEREAAEQACAVVGVAAMALTFEHLGGSEGRV